MDPTVLRPILERTHQALGRPNIGGGSTREQRNQFFLSFVAVMHYGHPVLNPGPGDPRWVAKSAGGGRPQSDDMIAFQDGASLRGWDLILGSGADGFRFIDASGPGEDITGQEPIVPPRSALPPAGPGPITPTAPPTGLQIKAEPWIGRVDDRFRHLRLGSEDQQREWMARVAFVLRAKVDPAIGQKRADASRPISRNTLGVGRTGALEAVVLIDENTKERVWQSLGTVDQVLVDPPAFDDMADVLAAAPAPAPAPAPAQAVDLDALKRQLIAIQDAAAAALRLLS
ncbi:MAG: hypothetical protein AB7O28_11780 [Vicinamibacterales bacterium]